jgi:polysaccharide export outer membrane protein
MKSNKYFFLLLIGGIFLASCVPQKKIIYLQSQSDDDSINTFVNERKLDYKVQPGDNLYIKINSLEERSTAYFNQGGEVTGGSNLYLTSYLVSDSGYFNFPSLGFLYVKDMTAEEIQ